MVQKVQHRPSRRIRGFDYSQPGFYFVTIVTEGRRQVFIRGSPRAVVIGTLRELPRRFPTVSVDRYACMPDHVHLLLLLDGQDPPAQLNCAAPDVGQVIGRSFRVDPMRPTLGQVVRTFKAVVTRRLHLAGHKTFRWQRNYFEWVIRDEAGLQRVSEYIQSNPLRLKLSRDLWAESTVNSQSVPPSASEDLS